jgi:hypothetical protein
LLTVLGCAPLQPVTFVKGWAREQQRRSKGKGKQRKGKQRKSETAERETKEIETKEREQKGSMLWTWRRRYRETRSPTFSRVHTTGCEPAGVQGHNQGFLPKTLPSHFWWQSDRWG